MKTTMAAVIGSFVLSTLVVAAGNATAVTREANTGTVQVCADVPVRPQPSVRRIQCLLNLAVNPATFPLIPEDGQSGPATVAKLKLFQGCAGLPVDGRVGPRTLAELEYWANSGSYVC
ncbi:peptidoglycan-binding domain-containing protein [Actinophytocola sp.]|uniref:peptidoglycan-binding domain-containing protein n=1 Tax=Actinophytocola sp. TaxID=1872138 RepID=UPI002ED02F0C